MGERFNGIEEVMSSSLIRSTNKAPYTSCEGLFHFPSIDGKYERSERQNDVAPKKRNLYDDIVEGTRRLLEDLDRLLDPEKRKQQKQQPVPIPIPVEPENPRHRRNDSYR